MPKTRTLKRNPPMSPDAGGFLELKHLAGRRPSSAREDLSAAPFQGPAIHGSAAASLNPHLARNPFLVTLGRELFDFDLGELVEFDEAADRLTFHRINALVVRVHNAHVVGGVAGVVIGNDDWRERRVIRTDDGTIIFWDEEVDFERGDEATAIAAAKQIIKLRREAST
jgi:hypothetical protein